MSGINHAVFFAHLPEIDAPHHLGSPISSVVALTNESLVIVLLSQQFRLPQANTLQKQEQCFDRIDHWDDIQRLLTYVYVKATKAAQDLGKILLDVSVVLKDPSEITNDFPHCIDLCIWVHGGAFFSRIQSVPSLTEESSRPPYSSSS